MAWRGCWRESKFRFQISAVKVSLTKAIFFAQYSNQFKHEYVYKTNIFGNVYNNIYEHIYFGGQIFADTS